MTPWSYVAGAALVLAINFLVFRVIARRSYRGTGRLTWAASTAQYGAILAWLAFGCLNLPKGWPAVGVPPVQAAVGWILFVGGWMLVLFSLLRLGVRRSHGVRVTGLVETGFYRVSRNPQATAFLVSLAGYLLLWPTWRNAGVVLLAAHLLHLMILSEEEHLLDVFPTQYASYTHRVPRYLGRIS